MPARRPRPPAGTSASWPGARRRSGEKRMTDEPARPGQPGVRRRDLVRAALGGLAAGPLLRARAAAAAPATDHGPVVTPDPIRPKVRKSGLAVGLADFAAPPRTA